MRLKKPSNFANVSRKRVNCFVDYFSNIVNEMKSVAFPVTNFVWRYNDKKKLGTDKIFRFSYISIAFVERELRHVDRNKATGTDSLPPSLLKDCSRFLASPLAHILNLSLNNSTVPSMWKLAKISPTFKSGKLEHAENYRLISVLPVLSKILEKAVHLQLYIFLESNNLLYDCQFGFRKVRSTKLATTLFCDKIRKEMDKCRLVGSIFLDLSKAFDTIGHEILLEKLIRFGVCGPELAWFTDYLFNRLQLIEINNITSDKQSITSSVPQGSILGPLMFIIFFNDLEDSISYCDIF